ncbi:hypothetical protein K505DRAFT_345716 [Melanomma pulvis-pyrius CBS 109.77]|uniref:Heterokaryon incompatibility domain-containing protein n=1 Tax=Melanomma pulvis-pyrius CBS 109.77 TaxID=1314802 RepID=A0A6A6XTH4_9PLEO|nr:hypothetical protein K505DRAFT_345716 [Melanomma pulvis-pyrius CBS 109.77]
MNALQSQLRPWQLPTRLIYVGTVEEEKLRLVETREEELPTKEYIALSHPWGDIKKHKPFSTLRKDPSGAGHGLSLFKQSIPYDQLPATFKDAVYYSLCIIQGKDGDFTEEAVRMEDVFNGAYCVLAASRADRDGFLGPRLQQEYITFQREGEKPFYVCKTIDNFSKDVLEGSLIQERALARRTKYFTENQTYFECGSGIRCETLTRMHNNMADILGDPRFPEKAMPTNTRALEIEYFQDLYRLYSQLQFTRYEDRPFAVAGLEKRLFKTLQTKGGHGIFDDGDRPDGGLFHRSLLWRRRDEKVNLTPINFPAERDIRVPSWDFTVAGSKENKVNLMYDTERTTGTDGQRAQCVIVAKSMLSRSDRERVYYVLLVARTKRRGEMVYVRVGAGTMLGRFITLDGLGISAKIY